MNDAMTVNGDEFGRDVSAWQGDHPNLQHTSFTAVKHTEGSQGHGSVNPYYFDQVDEARARGDVVIHYLYPIGTIGLPIQVDFFASGLRLEEGDGIAADWEQFAMSGHDKDELLTLLERRWPTHRVLLYCNRNFWFHRDTTSEVGDGLWIADPDHPAGHPGIQHPWVIHQYGITNGIDANVANFTTVEAMRGWFLQKAPKQIHASEAPEPKPLPVAPKPVAANPTPLPVSHESAAPAPSVAGSETAASPTSSAQTGALTSPTTASTPPTFGSSATPAASPTAQPAQSPEEVKTIVADLFGILDRLRGVLL